MLTFDWDDVGISHPRVQKALNRLIEEFGKWYVYVRMSSSTNGLHVVIAEKTYDEALGKTILTAIPLEPEQSQQWRTKFAEEPWLLECKGRLESDRPRAQVGLAVGRLFGQKNGDSCGPWVTAARALQEESVIQELQDEIL
ncbi:MAG: hypothetical protein CL398_00365 [Acidiferrobacteraceae bacterium]|nr:hypothetical protein [Acidiferrobacteraceae bacterium]